MRPVLYEPRNEKYYTSRSNFTDGTSSMGNSFSTIWSSWKDVRPVDQFSITNGIVSGRIENKYLKKTLSVDMIKSGVMQFNTLYFPGWRALVNGKYAEILYKNNGTIQLELPEGSHTVSIRYVETSLRFFADVLSIASLIGIALWGILSVRKTRT